MSDDFKKELSERFQRYVKVHTTSDENSTTCPSTRGQLELGRIMVGELKAIGAKNAIQDKNGYVYAELPANGAPKAPAIGLIAHFDTAQDVSGKDVKPQIHKNYNGGDIVISKQHNLVLRPKEAPGLAECKGHDIITASGGTLLGADNKAGIAIIMAAANWLVKHPDFKHGPVKIAFTPDEEIGRGANLFDLKRFKANCAYTIDGDVPGVIEDETFNAHGVTIEITGASYHPGSAKNLMANAVRIGADIISAWPENMVPETTENKEGFIAFMSCESSVEKAVIKGIVREHDAKKLLAQEKLLSAIVEQMKLKYPNADIKLTFKEQYRNMKEVLDKQPKVAATLEQAIRNVGLEPIKKPIRGGTDGARLSFMGLPTPNLFVGGGNFHGPYEWVSINGMESSVKTVLNVLELWAKQ